MSITHAKRRLGRARKRASGTPPRKRDLHDYFQGYYQRNHEHLLQTSAERSQRRKSIPAPRNGKKWTPAEDATVMRDDLSVTEMAYLIGRSYKAVVGHRAKLANTDAAATLGDAA